jgi:AmpD protein
MSLTIDDAGLIAGIPYVASPNCDERPAAAAIDLLVIHGISLPPGEFGGEAIDRLFTNTLDHGADPYFESLRDVRVSAHFLIRRDGSLVQYVPCLFRAWHAGESNWRGRSACNDFSIGIELEGSDEVPYVAAQYAALGGLVRALVMKYPVAGIAGHSEIAPGRKTDPGPHFDWARFRALL